jgi:hypothetical protein
VSADRGSRADSALALAGMAAVFGAVFSQVKAANFGGTDEWLVIDLASRGIIDFPYARRPLSLLGQLPPALLFPHSVRAFLVFHAGYLLATGVAARALVRRLAPARPLLAFVAGLLACLWGPGDWLRLDSVLMSGASFLCFLTVLALVLLLEAQRRGGLALGALACLAAFVAGRGAEPALALLGAGPVLLYWSDPAATRRRWGLPAAWTAVVALDALLFLLPLLGGGQSYQTSALGLDPHPAHVASRLGAELVHHLAPVVTVAPRELAHPAAVAAALLFVAAWTLLARRSAPLDGPSRALVLLAVAGLALAVLADTPFALSGRVLLGVRRQFYSALGAGLFLAAALSLLAGLLPAPWRKAAAGALAAWVVWVGAARTLEQQAWWDTNGVYARQSTVLRAVTDLAPDLEPHTLVVMLDGRDAWRANFTFHHAVRYLYETRAVGLAFEAHPFLYPTSFTPAGVAVLPWPVIQGPWRSPSALFRYDECVVFRSPAQGPVELLEAWPPELPPLPAGATYAPRRRLRAGALPARAVLGS